MNMSLTSKQQFDIKAYIAGFSIAILSLAMLAGMSACQSENTVEVTANVAEKPRLVIQITVDQFRGDLPTRYVDRLGEGGLRYLLEEGIHYNNAHHAHANTETIVGHVTLATGAHPAVHGMIGNIWFENTLIVLSADHGSPEAPAYLKSIGIPADYVSPGEWDTAPAIARIKTKFGIRGKMIEGYDHPYLYLTSDIINDPDIDLAALETTIAKKLVAFPAVSYAVPSTSLERGTVPDNGLLLAAVHGSPWRYDTYVPILFAGYGIKPQTVSRRVHTVDVALTLATAIGTKPPLVPLARYC